MGVTHARRRARHAHTPARHQADVHCSLGSCARLKTHRRVGTLFGTRRTRPGAQAHAQVKDARAKAVARRTRYCRRAPPCPLRGGDTVDGSSFTAHQRPCFQHLSQTPNRPNTTLSLCAFGVREPHPAWLACSLQEPPPKGMFAVTKRPLHRHAARPCSACWWSTTAPYRCRPTPQRRSRPLPPSTNAATRLQKGKGGKLQNLQVKKLFLGK